MPRATFTRSRRGGVDAAIATASPTSPSGSARSIPSDFDARLDAARRSKRWGVPTKQPFASARLHDDLEAAQRTAEALDALKHAVRLDPSDRAGRTILARATVATGDVLAAAEYLDRDTAGTDRDLLVALVELELRQTRIEPARGLMTELLVSDRESRHQLIAIGWALVDLQPEASYACIDVVAGWAADGGDYRQAAADLQEFASRRPGHVPSLLKLVEVCVDGALDTEMHQAQVRLTDAYLQHGHAAEARVIAEDLLAREPGAQAHLDRYRRALVMLGVDDPDTQIAERLNGQIPFMPNEPFVDLSTDERPSTVSVPVGTAAASIPVPAAVVAVQPIPVVPLTSVAAAAADARLRPDAAPARAASSIDLTTAVGELDVPQLDAPGAGVQTLRDHADLDDALDGMAEDTDTEDEFAAQYVKLAHTYVEMGMVDEAIESLKTAARSSAHRFEAAAMLGRLFMDRKDTRQAIQWMEHAAEEPAPAAHDGRALLYDLGTLLDETGEVERALAVFLELQADTGDYRDVPLRIDRLARVQSGG